MRRKPGAPADLILKDEKQRGIKRETRTYRFLTYVMGGGVKVHGDENMRHQKDRDKVTPVRVASIRGQLRFWWRACNPSQCKDVDALRRREEDIWGSSEKPSRVILRIGELDAFKSAPNAAVYHHAERVRDNQQKTVLEACSGMDEIAYGAFPLQPKNKRGVTPGPLHDYTKLTFALQLEYPSVLEDDVQAALWAWETFGGLGGRTRRGFGAIECCERSQTIPEIRSQLAKYQGPRMDGVPSLSGAIFDVALKYAPNSALEAWKHGLGVLQNFRQGSLGRNPGRGNRPGRSKWPEADTIRALTGDAHQDHARRLVHVDKFPRAQFGLPIIVHFKDGPRGDARGNRATDPADCTIKPSQFDRMASPLILRPIRDGGKYRAMALVLPLQLPPGGTIVVTDKRNFAAPHNLVSSEARSIAPLAGNQDPLARFVELLKQDTKK